MSEISTADRVRITRVTDRTGRVIGVRRPGVLQRLRMFETVGPDNARNEQYLGFAGLAVAVVEIDGEVCEPIATKRQLEARIQQLDDHGLEAVGAVLIATSDEGAAPAAPSPEAPATDS